VFEASEHGPRPLPGSRVFVVDLDEGPYNWFPWYDLTADANGRFSFDRALTGRIVKLTAYEKTGLGPLSDELTLFQVRAVQATVGVAMTIEIELVRRGQQPRILVSPSLSGVVVETTPAGPRPAADMAVLYSSNRHDGADVYTRTDAEGRYGFWNLPIGGGHVLPRCSEALVEIVTFPVEITDDTVLNLTCP
ncbi:MAG TPA: hypothetical protein VFQ06_02230, partial [Nitrospira sp.]|nr:hypothetical protein [Nitrospira sp.]